MTAAAGRGTTTIADKAVRKIAEQAVREALPAPAAAAGAGRGAAQGSATVRGRRATVALRVTLPYPVPLAETARQVQQHVAERTRQLTGLHVPPPRLAVTRLAAREEPLPPPAQAPRPEERGRAARRWWSARRIPMALVLLPVAAVCAAVTADVIRVQVSGDRAAAWRLDAVEWLAGHRLGDAVVALGGSVAAALGVWLLVLAWTPGRRRRLVLDSPGPQHTVAVDRSSVATLVRDAVSEVDGVGAVHVRARRRRVRVRARLVFGDRETARRDAVAAAERVVARCGLLSAPSCRVTVTPEPTWQPPDPGRQPSPPVAAVGAPGEQEGPPA